MTTSFRARVRDGQKLIGMILTLPSPEIAEICVGAGFDWLFLDMEHGLFDTLAVQRVVQAVAGRCACVVRVPSHDPVWLKKVLDVGVDGVIIPQVNTADQALTLVRHSKYPPQGDRSTGIGRAQGYGVTFAQYVHTANDSIAVIAQIEHIDGVRSIENILNVSGLDGVFIGPFDLSASLNKPGQITDPEVQAAITQVQQACATRQFPIGIFAPTLERAQAALATGYTVLAAGADISLLTEGAQRVMETLKLVK